MRTKKQINSLKLYFFSLFFIIFLLFMIATSNSSDSFVTSNENNVKAVQSSRIHANYKNNLIETVMVNSLEELKNNINKRVKFTGTITGYGPDCVGCSGVTASGHNVYEYVNGVRTQSNITYFDSEFGEVRILAAANSKFPFGSIIRITGDRIDGSITGIVLDTGGAMISAWNRGEILMDLLFASERDNAVYEFGRQNVTYEVLRYGR